jgi:hypothetical protein
VNTLVRDASIASKWVVEEDGTADALTLRLMHEDNLLCLRRRAFVPATTDSVHGWRVVPNLTHGMVLTGIDQLWVADITYIRYRDIHNARSAIAVFLEDVEANLQPTVVSTQRPSSAVPATCP